jgi:hypothetical protein
MILMRVELLSLFLFPGGLDRVVRNCGVCKLLIAAVKKSVRMAAERVSETRFAGSQAIVISLNQT